MTTPQLTSQVEHALAAVLDPALRKTGEPPDVYFLYHHEGKVLTREIGLPWVLWVGREAADVLDLIARAAEGLLIMWRLLVPAQLIGVALRCEAWVVDDSHPALTPDEVRRHPHARNVRFICAVDRSGTTYGVEADASGFTLHTAPAGHGPGSAAGLIPEALDRLLTAVLGVTLPTREQEPPEEEGRHAQNQ